MHLLAVNFIAKLQLSNPLTNNYYGPVRCGCSSVTRERIASLFACLAFGRGFFSFDVLKVSEVNYDLWFAPRATVRTACLSFDLLNIVDDTVYELLHGYVLVVATFAALNV